jgi:hypothetical protein
MSDDIHSNPNEAPETLIPNPPLTRANLVRAAQILFGVVTAIGTLLTAGAGAYKYASESGASQATASNALVLLRTTVDEHTGDLRVIHTDMDVVKQQNQISIKDRADIREQQRRDSEDTKRYLDKLDGKLDRIIEQRLPPRS